MLKFIQESEEYNDVDDWEPLENLTLKNSSQPGNDLPGNVADTIVNDSKLQVDIPHSSSDPPVSEKLYAIPPLVVPEAAAVPSMENVKIVLVNAFKPVQSLP